MHLVNELKNDLALSILVDRKNKEVLDSKDLLPLLSRVREVLEPITEKDHSQDQSTQNDEAYEAGV